MPFCLALTLSLMFTGFVVQFLWLALAGLVLTLAVMAGWVWPEEEARLPA